jgi:predicted outer membrane repeat protein
VQLFRCSTLLEDCAFEGNTAVANGGGIHAVLGTATVRASSISQNLAYSGGGGLSWDAGGSTAWSLRLEDSLVTKNSAQIGVGGVRVFPNPQVPTLAIVASEVCGNAGGNIDGFYSADAASTVCECAGDIDASGVINGVDLSALLSVWGTAGAQYPRADANRDGLVSAADLAIVLSNWGPCAP